MAGGAAMIDEIVLPCPAGLMPSAGGFTAFFISSTPTPVTGVDAPGFRLAPKFNGARPSGLRDCPPPLAANGDVPPKTLCCCPVFVEVKNPPCPLPPAWPDAWPPGVRDPPEPTNPPARDSPVPRLIRNGLLEPVFRRANGDESESAVRVANGELPLHARPVFSIRWVNSRSSLVSSRFSRSSSSSSGLKRVGSFCLLFLLRPILSGEFCSSP